MQTNGSNIISMNINLGSMENRERSASEIADIIRADLRDYPEIHKGTVTEGMGGMGGAATVDVEIYGYDFQYHRQDCQGTSRENACRSGICTGYSQPRPVYS